MREFGVHYSLYFVQKIELFVEPEELRYCRSFNSIEDKIHISYSDCITGERTIHTILCVQIL